MEKVKRDNENFKFSDVRPLSDLHFGRDIFAKQLEKIISNLDDSFVISLDSQWGSGKTYFLKRFEAYLKKKKYCVLYYNAWENDDEKDPFTSLIVEFTSQMKEYVGKNKVIIKNIMKNAGKLFLKNIPIIVGNFAGKYVGEKNIEMAKEFYQNSKEELEKISVKRMKELGEDKKTKEDFKESLRNFRLHVSNKKEDKKKDKIIILVDELDRCRPDYAVELLERIKHLFNVENYIFVLGIDREQIVNSIKQIYGKDMDDRNYLKRFFDFEFTLPPQNIKEYMSLQIDKLKLKVKSKDYQEEKMLMLEDFGEYCELAELSIREVQKNFTSFKLILDSMDEKEFHLDVNKCNENISVLIFLPYLFVAKYISEELYLNALFYGSRQLDNHSKQYKKNFDIQQKFFEKIVFKYNDNANIAKNNLTESQTLFDWMSKVSDISYEDVLKNTSLISCDITFEFKNKNVKIYAKKYKQKYYLVLPIQKDTMKFCYDKIELMNLFIEEPEDQKKD
ncbi:MAG: KAP family P-loop NTPase fold protein [Fusobacteriaceae bacterium]